MPLCVVQPNTVHSASHQYFPHDDEYVGTDAKHLVLVYNGRDHYTSSKRIPCPEGFKTYHLGKVDALLAQAESATKALVAVVGVEEMRPVLSSVREAINRYNRIRQEIKGTDMV